VPAIKDQIGDLDQLDLNHFKCYRAHRSQGEQFPEQEVALVDQFETKDTVVTRPFLLCNPVNKNGEGVPHPSQHLTCYKITDAPGQPPFEPQQPNVTDQFVVMDLQTKRRTDCGQTRILCVPSNKRIAGQTTTTSTTTTSTTTPTTTTVPCGGGPDGNFFCGGMCPAGEACIPPAAGGSCRCVPLSQCTGTYCAAGNCDSGCPAGFFCEPASQRCLAACDASCTCPAGGTTGCATIP
jgi:hypothetical protein